MLRFSLIAVYMTSLFTSVPQKAWSGGHNSVRRSRALHPLFKAQGRAITNTAAECPKLHALIFTRQFYIGKFPYLLLQGDQIAKITKWISILALHVNRWACKLAKWEGVMCSKGYCGSLLVRSFNVSSSDLLQGLFARRRQKGWTRAALQC